MRDLLSKLDAIVSETALNAQDPKGDYEAKKKALDDLEADPVAAKDPEISSAIDQRRSDLDKEAKAAGVFEVGDSFGISFSEDFEIGSEIVGFVEDGIVIDLDETALKFLEDQGVVFYEGELTEGLRDPKDNPCWKGYKPVGTKKKGGRTVPNCVPKEGIEEVSPPGFKGTVKAMKKHDEIDNPFALAWHMKNKGYKSHKKADGSPKNEDSNPEYDDEAGMADNNIETMKRAVQGLDDLIQSGDNLPEWCQEKIAVSKSMLVAVWDYMQSEEQHEGIENEAQYHGKNVPLGKKLPGDVKKSKVYVRKPNGNIVKVNFGDKKMRIKKSNPARRRSFRARHNCKNPGPRWKARYWSCRSW